ncbi:hypothetical protein GCM10022631_14740 [Deinococcus rubellus]|uniref:Glycosyl hydrolases family 39 N-terminal catalytic domain-containing protein n=1 Tax=Deinococcus rubellus TaxID=1889240 RepID=A0ABY5YLB5_9DEIO|nr:hypothetical protein [Deinococcus rubellus]UWX64926.1 hypothetical protein N0D28_04500 [Deinococcus rubellus]
MPLKTQVHALLMLSLSFAIAGSAAAMPATLTLSAAPATPLPPTVIGGFNYGNWMPVVEAEKDLRSVAPTLLRFPGGNVGDENDLNAASLVPLKSNLEILTTGKEPPALMVQTRVFGGKPGAKNAPEDAAQAAKDTQAASLKVAYWEIGNEPDLYSVNRGDATWTAQRYCDTFRAQRQAILNVDPAARFAGPAVSNTGDGAVRFLSEFVKGCGDIVDLLTWHEYPTDGQSSDADALASVSVIDRDVKRFRALMDSPESNPKGYTRRTPLGVTEYSLSYFSNRPRHLSDQVGALWAAEATVRLAENGASVAAYFALQATGGHGLVDLAGIPRPTLYAFQQLHAFTGSWLPMTSDDPALWTHAAQDGALLSVLVTNTATEPHPLTTALPGYQLVGGKTFTQKTVDDEDPMIRLPLAATLELPARSLTRLVYKKQ